jgi:hypothetical protein
LAKRRTEVPPATQSRRFACPFFKRRPAEYMQKKSCPGPGWDNVHRMKEHLYRSHEILWQCERCGEVLENEADLRRHQKSETPCQVRSFVPAGGMTLERRDQLRSRKRAAGWKTEEEKWLDIYSILFPDDDLSNMPTPCKFMSSCKELV